MIVKKVAGTIIGAHFSKAEQRAIDIEIEKQLAEFDRANQREINASVLWTLHELHGFGAKRLRDYYDKFDPAIDALIKRYEFSDEDGLWLCTYKLKEIGADLEAWENEKNCG